MNFIDPFGLDTKEIGVSLSGSLLGLGGDITLTIGKDSKGDTGIVFTLSGGGHTDPISVSGHGVYGQTNASSINSLSGKSVKLGTSYGEGVEGSYEHVFGNGYHGGYGEFGLNLGYFQVDEYGMGSNSYVINLNDMVEKLLHDYLKVPLPEDNFYRCK